MTKTVVCHEHELLESKPVDFEVPNSDSMRRYQRLIPALVDEMFGNQHWFFLYWSTGETVAYAHVRQHKQHIELFDLEVQECYQGLGYAREALSVLAWDMKKPIRHIESAYSQLGLERVAHFFNTGTPDSVNYPTAVCKELKFVVNWEFMLSKDYLASSYQ